MKRMENIKIFFLWKAHVGKTNIINQFCRNRFFEDYLPTIGYDSQERNINIDD